MNLNLLNISFLLAAFATSLAVVYMVVLIMRRWYFNLSPRETATFALVMFLLGFMASSYLLGSLVQVFEAALVIFILFAWFIWRSMKRRSLHKQSVRAGVGVSPGERV